MEGEDAVDGNSLLAQPSPSVVVGFHHLFYYTLQFYAISIFF